MGTGAKGCQRVPDSAWQYTTVFSYRSVDAKGCPKVPKGARRLSRVLCRKVPVQKRGKEYRRVPDGTQRYPDGGCHCKMVSKSAEGCWTVLDGTLWEGSGAEGCRRLQEGTQRYFDGGCCCKRMSESISGCR